MKTFHTIYLASKGKVNNYQLIAILHNFKGEILLLQRQDLKIRVRRSSSFFIKPT